MSIYKLVVYLFIISGLTLSVNHSKAQYCSAGGNCTMYISRVQVGTIDNSSACDSYADYTAFSTDMDIGTGYPITVTNGFGYAGNECYIWVDWNHDYDFYDAGELVLSATGVGPYSGTITPPTGAALGNTRMRIRIEYYNSADPCGSTTYGEVEDYTINVTAGNPMTFVSCTATQNETSDVLQGTTNQEIIGLQVVTSGTDNPLSATEFRIRTNGTTDYSNDITNMRIWYTGTSPTFATGTQFGTAATPQAPGTNTIISGNQTLATGTNYFWVTYDITVGATTGNIVDAVFQNVDVGGLQTPVTSNPAGSRTIAAAPDMTYSSCTVTQASTADVYPGHNNREIICVQVVTSGILNPLSISSFQLQTTGCTNPVNDLSNTKIFYTGTSSVFATGTQFGTTYNGPPATGTNYSISGNQTLAQGTNYFWVTYDISGSATVGNLVDGICNQITVDGSNYGPSVTNPAGNRLIVTPVVTECDNATPLSIGTVCYTKTFSSVGLTPSNIPNGACGDDNVNDIWFKTVVPSSGELIIHTEVVSVAMDGIMALYYGPCTNLTEITCLDDVSGTPVEPMPTIYKNNLIPGNILYIRFWEKNDVQANFRICCYDPSIGVGIDVDPAQNDPTTLVETVLLDENGCLEALNISHTGFASSISYFDDGNVIGFSEGIILASGYTSVAEGQNNSSSSGSNVGTSGDADLNILASPYTTYNASILEFDFIPSSDTVSFRYVFGSEEYPEYVCSSYNDVFGFFLSGPGISGPYSNNSINIAQVPNDYSGSINPPASYFTDPVAINAINDGVSGSYGSDATCNGQYPDWKDYVHYFVNNGTGSTPSQNQYTQLDGYTTPLVARAVVTACETYHIKLAVADASDGVLDSSVFLEANSFKSPDPPQMSFATATADMNQVYEGCSTTITITRAHTQDVLNPEIVYLDLTGSTATSGIDYPAIPNPVVIPPGDSSVTIEITPYIDAETPEADETIVINYQEGCPCTTSPIQETITLKDYVGISGGIDNVDPIYCQGGSPIDLTTTVSGQGNYTYDWNTGATTSSISVSPSVSTIYSVDIIDSCGNSLSDQVTVTFINEPTTSFTHTATPCSYNNTVNFNYTGNAGSGASYLWSFPGGTPSSSTAENPVVTYPPGASYMAELTTVTTSHGCVSGSSTTLPVNIPTAVTGNATGTDALCNGDANGSADLTPSGGTPGYTYTWNPGGMTTEDVSGLTAGIYTVVVTDNNGCVNSDPIQVAINQPAVLNTLAPTIDNPDCFGGSDGSVQVNPAGGTPSYSYIWNTIPQQTVQTATGLTAGTYGVTITDSHNCITTDSYTVTQPAAITLDTTYINPTCGASNGQATVNASQGTPPYSYTWSTSQTTQTIVNLPAGTYTVTVSDNNSCTEYISFALSDIGAPDLDTTSVTHVSCFGADDGTAIVEAAGGTLPYTFLWSTGETSTTASGLEGTVSGYTHNVTVTDNVGCIASVSIKIFQPTQLMSSLTGTDVLCNDGSSTGAADLQVGGGTPSYSYLWSNSATTEDLNGIGSGTYTVTITDNNGCTLTDQVSISVPDALVTGIVEDSVECHGQNNGSADLTVTGGTQPYTYHWSGGQISQDIYNQFAGTYSVTVTDGNGCTQTDNITIYEPELLSAGITGNDLLCYEDNTGSADLVVSGGITDYTYLWTTINGSGLIPANEDQSGLSAGNYYVVITDHNGCQTNAHVAINQPDELISEITGTDPDCFGETGSVDLGVLGGTTPYSYVWSNGATTQDISNLTAGTYNVTVTDDNNCEILDQMTITVPTEIISSVVSDSVICYGQPSGSANLTVSGGTMPISYLWSGGQTTQDIYNQYAGNYTVTITDNNGCTKTEVITIYEPDTLVTTVTGTDLDCYNDGSGSADLTVTGGTPLYTYIWNPGGYTTEDISNVPAGFYTVITTDHNGCGSNAFINITEPPVLSAQSPTIDEPDCNGYNDGSVTANPAGGTPGYDYIWNTIPSQTDQTASNLIAGNYTVTITDNNGCTYSDTYTVNEPDAITLTPASSDATCGLADGSASVTPTGGAGGYTYEWSTGATTQFINGIDAGSYSVTVTDAHLCTESITIDVTNSGAPELNTTAVDHVSCYGFSNGSISIVATGGTEPYEYEWQHGPTTTDITGLSAGLYYVVVTDAMGCMDPLTVLITEPQQLVANISGTDVACNDGSTTGSADLSVAYGTPPYSYSWSNGETTQDLSNIGTGTYTVTVTDDQGCILIDNVDISVPDMLVHDIVSDSVICNGQNTGSADLTITGGIPPYTYNWSGGQNSEDIYSQFEGTYYVTITDHNGCSALDTITIYEPDELISNVSGTDLLCYNDGTGEADITVTGGTPGYSYTWSTMNGSGLVINDEDQTGLSAGVYNIVITDHNGCQNFTQITIYQPDTLISVITGTDPDCYDGQGNINLNVNGGTTPYSFLWSNGETSQNINGLDEDTYSVTVTDQNNCETTNQVSITIPPELITSVVSDSVICYGQPSGSADLTVSGGTQPITYNWSGGQITQDIYNQYAGTYTVTITDNNGCTKTESITIYEPDLLETSVTGTDLYCFNDGSGSVDLTVTGGTPAYTFLWNPGGYTTEDISNVPAGFYTVITTDQNGCGSNAFINITEPPVLSAQGPTIDEPDCNGYNDGSVTANPTGGTPGYSYVWNTIPSQTDQTASNLIAGNYTVTITDNNGCTYSDTYTVNEPDAITLTPASSDATCGLADGSASVTPTGGAGGYTYEWSTGATTQFINGIDAGSYSVTVTDAHLCTESITIDVTNSGAPELNTTAVDHVSCYGFSDGSISIVATGGTEPYEYVWQHGPTTTDITGLSAGLYYVVVTDAMGCMDPLTVLITEPQQLVANISGTDVACNDGSTTGSADLSVAYGTPPYSYSWSNGETTQDLSNIGTGIFTVTVTDDHGCILIDDVLISVPDAIISGIMADSVNCHGQNNGSADLTVNGGIQPYTFNWSGGQISQDIYNQYAGTYTVTITDHNGCTHSDNITIYEPEALTASVSGFDLSCYEDGTGSADLTVSGGIINYAYLWTTVNGDGLTPTTEDQSGLSAGNYNVVITDHNGCQTEEQVTIGQPDELISDISGTDPDCFGESGNIDLDISGGITPYNYLWSNGATSQNISDLSTGSYTVTITDSHNCETTDQVTITIPPELTASIVSDSVNCYGQPTGSANLTVGGGTQPISYLWSGGQTTQDIYNQYAGIYTVTVTDHNGCTNTESVTIFQPDTLETTITGTDLDCFNDASGTIDLTVTGGTPGYTFLWNPGGYTTEDISNIPAGFYTVITTDQNGCGSNSFINISEPPVLSAQNPTIDEPDCNGYNDGSITAIPIGGTPDYSYIWNTVPAQTDETASNLIAGDYTITITDNNGCTYSDTYTLNEPDAITLTPASSDATCGLADGSASVTPSGGAGSYTFEWSTGATSQFINGIDAGTYTVTVTDANMCTESISIDVTNSGAPTLDTTSVTNVSCYGFNDGTASIAATGGTPPYDYIWQHGPTTTDISGLAAGLYFVTVTDDMGCIDPLTVLITEPLQLVTGITGTDVACNDGSSSGSADLTVAYGTPPYSFLWSNGETTEDLSGIGTGTFTVTVTDNNGCTIIDAIGISVPEVLVYDIVSDSVICNGQNTGSANLIITGGTQPYSYNWSGGQNSQDIYGQFAGTYYVTITDHNGCTGLDTTTIYEPEELIGTIAGTDLLCYNDGTGEADLTVTGGTPGYSYSWSSPDGSGVVPGDEDQTGLSFGTYNVIITDDNGCQDFTHITIGQPDTLISVIAGTDPDCFGEQGDINLNVNGGTTPYSFIWSNGETTQNITGLDADTYSVTVTDQNNCETTNSSVITVPTDIVSSVQSDSVLCNGQNNGFIDLTVTGGTPPYSYLWSSGQISEDIYNKPAGTYYVTITDGNGCTELDTAVIYEPEVLTGIITGTDLLCHNDGTGEADISVTGGTEPYTYEWSTLNGSGIITNDEDQTGLSAGIYSVVITDDNGCQDYQQITINEPDTLTAIMAVTDPDCFGQLGSIDLNILGGTAPFSYLWSNGESTQNITGLDAGAYSVTVNDINNCEIVDSTIITIPTEIITNIAGTDLPCHGYSSGSADLIISGGTPNYYYNWSNGASNQDIAGLVAGTYYVTVSDDNGCIKIDSVTITQPDSLIGSINASNLLCFEDSTGSADLTVTGGVEPYSYSWEGPDSFSSTDEDIAGLPAGQYYVAVTDSNDCPLLPYPLVNITQPALLVSSVNAMDANCNNENSGSIDLSVSGGTLPFSYLWSGGETDEDLDSIYAGTYYVTITDTNSCVTYDSVSINEPTAIEISITGYTDALCYGSSDGTVAIQVSGGSPNYSYDIGFGIQFSDDFYNLPANTYVVTVTDAHGCTELSDTIIIGQPEAILITLEGVVDAYCGQNDGIAAVSADNGIPPYQYAWNDPQSQANDTAYFLMGDMYYTVTVTDANGCTMVMDSIYVGDHPAGVASIDIYSDPTCFEYTDGYATVEMTGGTPPFTYLWSNTQTNSTATGLAEGIYYVTVYDANGCDVIASVVLTDPDELIAEVLSVNINDVLCFGGSTGSATVSVSGGTTPYYFIWTNGQTDSVAVNLSAGAYIVTVTDDHNCIATESVNISQPDSALSVVIIKADTVCYGGEDGVAQVQAIGGTFGDGYIYEWDNQQTGQIASGLSAGSYEVSATDGNGCVAVMPVTIYEAPEITYQFDTTSTSCNGASDGEITIAANVINPPYSYLWSTLDTSMHIGGLLPGFYTVTITDGDLCTTTAIIEVYNSPIPCLVIPNVITPNGDDWNETWHIDYMRLYDNVTIQVFNRWGEIVFEFKGDGIDYEFDTDKQWDGTSLSNGTELPMGAYVYVISFSKDSDLDPIQGMVTIIRKEE